MANFGPLAAEIISLVWGTPGNFNGFSVLTALLHGTLVVDVSQTLLRWTEGATYIRQGGHHVGHWPTFLTWTYFHGLYKSVRIGYHVTGLRFCLTGLISLCLDSFCVCVFVYYWVLYCCNTVRWTCGIEAWFSGPLLPSVLWHCRLGHFTHNNPSSIWPIICLVGRWTLLNHVTGIVLSANCAVYMHMYIHSVRKFSDSTAVRSHWSRPHNKYSLQYL